MKVSVKILEIKIEMQVFAVLHSFHSSAAQQNLFFFVITEKYLLDVKKKTTLYTLLSTISSS